MYTGFSSKTKSDSDYDLGGKNDWMVRVCGVGEIVRLYIHQAETADTVAAPVVVAAI